MFTLHNKELLDVKRLKPVLFMINVLKSKLKKIFSDKNPVNIFAIFINNLSQFIFPHMLLTGLCFTVMPVYFQCSVITHALSIIHTLIREIIFD